MLFFRCSSTLKAHTSNNSGQKDCSLTNKFILVSLEQKLPDDLRKNLQLNTYYETICCQKLLDMATSHIRSTTSNVIEFMKTKLAWKFS